MKNLTELTIPELQKTFNRTMKKIDSLDRLKERLSILIMKKRLSNAKFKKGDYIVGRAKVFNKKRSIIVKIEDVGEGWDRETGTDKILVVGYTAGDKKYEFDIKKVRLAKETEILKYKQNHKKWENKW